MKSVRALAESPAMDSLVLMAVLGSFAGLGLLLASLAGSPFGGAIVATLMLGGSSLWLSYFVRRQHMRLLGYDSEENSTRPLFNRSTTSFGMPLVTICVLSVGVAIGLAGALGGSYLLIPGLVARGLALAAGLMGLATLGRYYADYSSLACTPALELIGEHGEPGGEVSNSTSTALSNSHKLAAGLAGIGILLALAPLSTVAGLISLQIWLIGFLVLVREHRLKLWQFPKLLEFRLVVGLLTLGLLIAHFLNPIAGIEICGWLACLTGLANWLIPLASEPQPVTPPSGTLVVLEHLLEAREKQGFKNGTLAAIDRALGLRGYQEPRVNTDYRNRSLRGRDFAGKSLKFLDFSESDLRGSCFDGCRLEGVCFSKANLRGASFRGATLVYVVLAGADVDGTDFTQAKIFVSDVSGCELDRAVLSGTLLRGLISDDSTAWPKGINLDEVRSRRKLAGRLPRLADFPEAQS